MKQKQKNMLLIAGMLLVMLVSIFVYSFYTQKQIYQESTANLLSTYGQSAKTFTMFAQRNWNILTDWDSYLSGLVEKGQQEEQWQEYIAQKATWQYTDFFLFNEQCEFWTTAGRAGHGRAHEGKLCRAVCRKRPGDHQLHLQSGHPQGHVCHPYGAARAAG